MTEQIIQMRQFEKEIVVAVSSIIVLSAVVIAFLLFAGVLAWGERQTRHLGNSEIKDERPMRSQQGRSRPAAERKAQALINS
jgi:hypothetical protein